MMLWSGVAAAAFAQTAGGQAGAGAVTYERDYFAMFSPRTALDMVERVPGFALDEGEERRGFAAAAGNVLIDGAPPAGKAEDLADILERIPARDVLRIELIRGESGGAATAQAVRVNIVRSPSSGAGVWALGLERADDGELSPSAQASWSGRHGRVTYVLSASVDEAHAPIDGEELRFDAAGMFDERRPERIDEDEVERRLGAEITAPLGRGQLQLSLSLASNEESEGRSESRLAAASADLGGEIASARELEEIGEISGVYTSDVADWSLEAAALITRRWLSEQEISEAFEAGGGFDSAEWQARDVESGESIIRGAAERTLGDGARFAFGGEVAFNTLEQQLELTEDDGSGRVPIDVPGANVRVEEQRAEAYALLAWRADRWRFEALAAIETSRLTQSGDVSNEAELTYWKPSLQAVRAVGDDDQLRFRVYRDVGQLDFEDFAASAELSGGDVFAGNAELRPEASWRFEAAGDFRFESGAFDLTLFYWRIDDALDFIPVGAPPDLFDARGNIGSARLWGVRSAFEAPLPVLENARLRVEGLWRRSEVRDPLTGETRPQSETQESVITAELRQDMPELQLAWGIEFERERAAPEFRFDRVTAEREADEVEVWIETTRFEGLKLRLFAANLASPRDWRERRNFDPDRNGLFDGREQRRRQPGAVLGISLEGAF